MVKVLPKDVWLRYKALLSTSRELYVPVLPATLPYIGIIGDSFDYVPPEVLLERLRRWLNSQGIGSVFYFLTEGTSEAHPTDYEISVADLTEATLSELNNGFENVLVGTDFSWALFMDHEGNLHMAGPNEFFSCLKVWNQVEDAL